MKRITAVFCLFLLPFILTGQGYKSVIAEKKNVDADNQIYVPGRTFVYEVTITKGGKNMLLVKNGFNGWEWAEASPDSMNRILMVVLGPKKGDRTNKRQTEILYTTDGMPEFVETTGLIENADNVWLHPPRSGFFKSLELCPFPYVQLPLEQDKAWGDEITIGSHWSHPEWAEWEGELNLNHTYRIAEKVEKRTAASIYRLEAIGNSAVGQTKLEAFYSEKKGFEQLTFTLPKGDTVFFNLIEIRTSESPPLKNAEEYLRKLR